MTRELDVLGVSFLPSVDLLVSFVLTFITGLLVFFFSFNVRIVLIWLV